MHPDQEGYIDDLHIYFRAILENKLSPMQLQLHDYFSTRDPLYSGKDCFEEFPLIDGLPEYLIDEEKEMDDELQKNCNRHATL